MESDFVLLIVHSWLKATCRFARLSCGSIPEAG